MAITKEDFIIFDTGDYGDQPLDKIKWITGTKNVIEFDESFSDHAYFRDWCLDFCNNKIVFVDDNGQSVGSAYRYDIVYTVYFYSEEDAMACKLKWQ
jgi:hypothetical protein